MSPNSDRAKHTASKYDFVKVKVWLGEGMSHYYVLSRFLISRMLTVTKIPYMKAVKIALEVKKYLIDNNQFDVSQENLEAILFSVMESKGFGADYTKRYKMVNQFHQQRRPLIIVVCGAPCTGKSSLAQQLASRFNMPNVLQTDMFYELLRTSKDKPLHQRPLWERPDLDHAQLISEFQRECHVVRRSIDGDLVKTIRDGKSIIIEGLHLDPGLYLYEFGKYGIRHLHTRSDSLLPSQASARQDDAVLVEPVNPEPINPDAAVQQGAELEPDSSQAEEAHAPPLGPHGGTKESKMGLLGSAQGLLQSTPGRQAASAGTGMLFALRSMAIRLSPVLSTYVSHHHAEDESVNGQDNAAEHPQLVHSPGSEWIAQQLQKAYHGLTATIATGSQAQLAQPDSLTAAQDVKATQGQEQAQKKKGSPAPVFVPIVVSMDARDHKLLVEEWYSRQMAVSGQLSDKDVSDKDMTDSANATYSRIRLLQDHLCTYAERNVPVVSINFSNFSDTLDQLHDYLLQCIESAMAQH
ncbi:hypothetical protein WJX79_003730 [Trebouxia sp. C0005]